MTLTTKASYSEANASVRRENFAGEAGGGAATEYAKFRSFQKAKLKAVHAAVTVAGTAAGHKLDVYHGTTSIGSIALGTSAAGVLADSATLNEALASMDQVSVKTGADTVGKAHVIYEYEVDHDAQVTL
jgi:hypothetical protein